VKMLLEKREIMEKRKNKKVKKEEKRMKNQMTTNQRKKKKLKKLKNPLKKVLVKPIMLLRKIKIKKAKGKRNLNNLNLVFQEVIFLLKNTFLLNLFQSKTLKFHL